MATDSDFDKERAELVERHLQGLAVNPLVGPPDIGIEGGATLQEFSRLLGETARTYVPSEALKKIKG